jgi:hypothetical protein
MIPCSLLQGVSFDEDLVFSIPVGVMSIGQAKTKGCGPFECESIFTASGRKGNAYGGIIKEGI